MSDPILAALDTDFNGQLSAAEIQAAPESLKKMEHYRDGEILVQDVIQPLIDARRQRRRSLGFAPGGPGAAAGAPAVERNKKLFERFDADKSGILNADERGKAREAAVQSGASSGGRRTAGRRPLDSLGATPSPGPQVAIEDAEVYPDRPLYDHSIIRTFFIDFVQEDWEQELSDFYRSDVFVAAKLTVDGKAYPQVGFQFRGNSSFRNLSPGQKLAFNVSLDLEDRDQNLYGYRTLNLLNAHSDPSFLRTVLYNRIARDYIPAPKANSSKSSLTVKAGGCTPTPSKPTRSLSTNGSARVTESAGRFPPDAKADPSNFSANRRTPIGVTN